MGKRKRTPDPPVTTTDTHVWVKTKEGSYWRKKRGTVTLAEPNASFKKNNIHAKAAGPAAKRLVAKLHPFIHNLSAGRITLRFCNLFIKTLNQRDKLDFSLFRNFEIQEDFPLDRMIAYQLEQHDGEVRVKIPINEYIMSSKSKLITHYYFELVLLHGDPAGEKNLKTETAISDLYPYTESLHSSACSLSVILAANKDPWMLFLKVSSLEGQELAMHPRHYAMRVVATG